MKGFIQCSEHPPFPGFTWRYHRWLANLRVLEINEVKSVPNIPMSHPFVERLIGTLRREYFDRVFFWNSADLERKLTEFKVYSTPIEFIEALTALRPLDAPENRHPPLPRSIDTHGNNTVVAYFIRRLQHN